MSIASIIYTGTTGLSVSQARIAVASTNIANAETTGYTAKTVDVTAKTVGGTGVGVQVIGSGSDVDENLHKQVVKAISAASYDSTVASYLETVSSALGTTEDGGGLTNGISDLGSALADVIANPGDTANADALTEALDDWDQTIADLGETIQSMRTSADAAIAEAVESVNDLLNQIDALNDKITKATADGTSTSDLEDQRRAALEELGQYVGVTTFTTASGAMQIYTSSGTALLTSQVHELSYTASGTLSADQTYESGAISGIMVDGNDLTASLKGGSIAALVTLRDETLPGIQDEIDELATAMDDILADVRSYTSGDTDTSALQTAYAALDASRSFAAQGNVSATSTSVSGYAQKIIDDAADRAETASDAASTSSATSTTLSESFSNTYGVNVDEETARLTTYQQDYEAAAQILATAKEMWSSLISMMS